MMRNQYPSCIALALFMLLIIPGSGMGDDQDPVIFGDPGHNAPEIRIADLSSDLPDHPSGGYLGTQFSLLVEYSDDDNDPPASILVTFDQGTIHEASVNITSMDLNPLDLDFTDSKLYLYEFYGWEIGETPSPHDIMITAWDLLQNGSSGGAQPAYLNDTLLVWDDDPVRINAKWSGYDPIMEDSGPNFLELEGGSAPFTDPEHNVVSASIFDPVSGQWADRIQTDTAHVYIMESEREFHLNVTPIPNMFGQFYIDVRVADDHTSVQRSVSIVIEDVLDLPYFDRIISSKGNTSTIKVTDTKYEVHLDALEGKYLNFTIEAAGCNGQRDIEISYDSTQSANWAQNPETDGYGNVSLLPENEDVKGNSSLMVWYVECGSIEVELHIIVHLYNVNDPPSILMPPSLPKHLSQFDQILISPIGIDPDPDDDLTWSFNLRDDLGSDSGALEDQLPFSDITGGMFEFNDSTGELWISFDDQNIWMTENGSVDEIEIAIVLNATDSGGLNASETVILFLKDINEPPDDPVFINGEPSRPAAGQPVVFWTEETSDPDNDILTYQWDFGDGMMGEGRSVVHIYNTKGFKTVSLYVSDGDLLSEKITRRIEVLDDGGSIWLDQDSDGDGIKNRYDSFPDDPAASEDSDGDGYPDDWNSGRSILDSVTGLTRDEFPFDATEHKDTDHDGYGDNKDEFPQDPQEWSDRDGDGIGDNSDRFPRLNNDVLRTIIIISMVLIVAVILISGIYLWSISRREEGQGAPEE